MDRFKFYWLRLGFERLKLFGFFVAVEGSISIATIDQMGQESAITLLINSTLGRLATVFQTTGGGVENPNQLSVGPNGDIPIFPPIAVLLCVLLGAVLARTFDKKGFLPKFMKGYFIRMGIFIALFACGMAVLSGSSAALKATTTGPNFTPVNGLATSGPFSVSRNSIYASMVGLALPGAVILADSLYMAAAVALVPLYLDRVVIPAEEALMKRLFGSEYEEYCARVPRWVGF